MQLIAGDAANPTRASCAPITRVSSNIAGNLSLKLVNAR
jgi:hypothetical protein